MKREMGELELIEQIRTQWGAAGRRSHGHARGVALGIGDDCAILRPPRGHELLVTTDFTLEGRHFRRDWHPAESAGHRTLARGLSDLAAMGARPLAAFLSLALPGEMLASRAGRAWIRRFFTGLRGLADQSAVPLAATPPSRPANWCWQTSSSSARPPPVERCAAARPAPETRSTSPANWVVQPPS
jgi:thiamine-monophosphate kinase